MLPQQQARSVYLIRDQKDNSTFEHRIVFLKILQKRIKFELGVEGAWATGACIRNKHLYFYIYKEKIKGKNNNRKIIFKYIQIKKEDKECQFMNSIALSVIPFSTSFPVR